MRVLGIESTCDETAIAVVEDGRKITSNCVVSQIQLHAVYGGVVPELACRRHIDMLLPVLQQSLETAGVLLEDIDLFAVATGPGLVGALLIGLHAAKALALIQRKPLIGVNHVKAHLYGALLSTQEEVRYPALGVVLSGGHTELVLLKDVAAYEPISNTVDDAIGEAFDKVAKILHLPYPGGPEIERLAMSGDPHRYRFTAGQVKGRPLHFSFSGLKTAVLYAVREGGEMHPADIAASFQKAAFEDVERKIFAAADSFGCNTIVFGGGVTASQTLRRRLEAKAGTLRLVWPTLDVALDNAAMIAGLGFQLYQKVGADNLSLDVESRLIWS